MNDFALKDSGARQEFDTGARRDLQKGKGRPDLISTIFKQRLAVVMEKGADKYGDRNWERGMPLSRYVASAMRHLDQYVEGWRDEDHLGQAAFNIMALVHTEQLIQDGELPVRLSDLPRRGVAHDDGVETTKEDVAAAEQFIKDYSPVIGLSHDPNGQAFTEYQQEQELANAGLVEGMDGVWRGKTTIDESVRNPGERLTPIYAQPAVFEPTMDKVRNEPETGELS